MLECLSPCLEKRDGQKKLNSRAKDEMTLKKDSKLDQCFRNLPYDEQTLMNGYYIPYNI